jgi:hypothetical protein
MLRKMFSGIFVKKNFIMEKACNFSCKYILLFYTMVLLWTFLEVIGNCDQWLLQTRDDVGLW